MSGDLGRVFPAWLRLLRLPTVFTALSNVLCGYFVAHEPQISELLRGPELLLLMLSTFGLYLGGMVLNDVFDAALDAVERPERPIPSGLISRRAAGWCGFGLLGLGLLAAAMASFQSGVVAVCLSACVLLYDVVLKSTWFGPFCMAGCRMLNFVLGASTLPISSAAFHPVLLAAVGLGIYILGVTWFSRSEAGRTSRAGLFSGLALVLCGLCSDGFLVFSHAAGVAMFRGSSMGLLLLGLNLSMRAAGAMSTGSPRLIQQTVGLMLLSLIFRDTMLVFALTGNAQLALITMSLLIPASLLRRVIPLS
jgi:4-hydroxybenzoate polyprenyltransferase